MNLDGNDCLNKLVRVINNVFKKDDGGYKFFHVGMHDKLSSYGYPKGFDVEVNKRYVVDLANNLDFLYEYHNNTKYIEIFFIKENDTLFKIFYIKSIN
jgi:hypothetical protein